MNKTCLIGRLTANPELRYNLNNKAYVRFNLAVNRNFTKEDGTREADFISCVGWEKTAETISKYFEKGSQIGIEGRIQTGSYTKEDGSKTYTTDVIVEHITFLDSKNNERPEPEYAEREKTNSEMIADIVTNDDPFAEFGQQVSMDDNFLD